MLCTQTLSYTARKENKVDENTKDKNQIKLKRTTRIFIYFYVVLFLLILLTVSTYTWFSLSKTPRVSSMSLYVATDTGMLLAMTPDSEDWGQQLSYLDMVDETAPLRPVTWSEKDQKFYAAVYGVDGRLTGKWEPLSDERNANRDDVYGYYCTGTFYAYTDQDVTVSLSPAIEVEEGKKGSGTYLIGTPVWDSGKVSHRNAGEGAENAVRIGIRVTRLADDNSLTDDVLFYIYEPNCDKHTDGSEGYVDTPSIDGTDTLVPKERIITQTTSTWVETDPVEKNILIHTYGEFTSGTELFSMEKNEKVQIKLYVWLEGQDVDCTNEIEKAQILASIQFNAEVDDQSGLQPIEP